MQPTVFIASPVRNRAWVLPAFLDSLEKLDHPAEAVSHHFLINDCVDASGQILRDWASRRQRAVVEEVRTGVVGWNRYQYPHYDFRNLARLRNHLLERFLASGSSHLFSVDSDVLVPPHALRYLLRAERPVVAAVIANLPGCSVEASSAHNFLLRRDGRYRHEPGVPTGIFEVDLTGAVVLIRREVIEAGARYGEHSSGEDLAFCRQTQALGFGLWCHGMVRCVHRMDDPGQTQRLAQRP